ncbi:MAG: PilZ domain-containing protein [Magnetococcales bacterium]|nr:PilZ domain-containing protein [Magnetococcales bacterium]
MSDQSEQRRRHERFTYHNAVTLTLDDGRRFEGTADNLGFGGAAMMVNGDPPAIPMGSKGKLRVIFFGRPTDYPCTVVSINGVKLGIQIQRTDYQGAPEGVLALKE